MEKIPNSNENNSSMENDIDTLEFYVPVYNFVQKIKEKLGSDNVPIRTFLEMTEEDLLSYADSRRERTAARKLRRQLQENYGELEK